MARDLPRDVHQETTRHGREVFYFRTGHGRRVRLPPDYGTGAFWAAVEAARSGSQQPYKPVIVTLEAVRKQRIERIMRTAVAKAKVVSKRDGMPYDLTLDWALAQIEGQRFKCALSGVPFLSDAPLSGGRHPFAPSLDRIQAGGPYMRSNVRIVTFAMNVMLLDWGYEVFERVENGYRVNRGYGDPGSAIPAPDTVVREL